MRRSGGSTAAVEGKRERESEISCDIGVKGRCGGTAWSESDGINREDLGGRERRLGMKRETVMSGDIGECVRMESKGSGMSGYDFLGDKVLFLKFFRYNIEILGENGDFWSCGC